MKYLLLILMLTGCATSPYSEYEQGCRDGLDEISKYDPYNDQIKNYVCEHLLKKKRRSIQPKELR